MACVSLSVNMTIINHFLRAKNGYVARKLKSVNVTIINHFLRAKNVVDWKNPKKKQRKFRQLSSFLGLLASEELMMIRLDLQTNFLVVARKVQAAVVVFGVVGLRSVDDEQAGWVAWPVALKLKKMAYLSITTPSKLLVLRAMNGYVARKLKKMAYVSLSVKVTIINHFLRASNAY